MSATPFTIAIEDAAIADLKQRLAMTRWPDEVNDDAWSWGTRRAPLQHLLTYWRDTYDWRAQEAKLNRLPQFTLDVDGQRIHFVHQRGKGPSPLPLVVTHGWPGSFVEMTKIIPLLTDPSAHGGNPADAFDVIVPSLPGYGFSSRPTKPGMNQREIATLWSKVMTALGYSRFGVQGGDWGSLVTIWTARLFPERVIGAHLNMFPHSLRPAKDKLPETPSPAEIDYIARRDTWTAMEGAYGHVHRTKPQTIAYALNDSPAGLAAWILEKFRTWTDCGGDPLSVLSIDEILTNISIYWFTQTISSSVRLYKEATPIELAPGEVIKPPVGYANFPKELIPPPRVVVERALNIAQWTDMPKGGHFAAFEQPDLLAADIRSFFRPLR